MKFHLCCS